jgi:hypothetical protein
VAQVPGPAENTGIVVGDDRRDVALFAGLLIARTREHTAQAQFVLSVAESIEERPITRDAVRQYLADKHLGFDPSDQEVEGAWSLVTYAVEQGDLPTRDEILSIWETLARAYRGIAPAHWRDVLDRALNSYESLKSIKATQGRNAAAIMTGSEIVAHHADGRARQLAATGLQLAAHVTAGHATATAELAQYSYRAP